MTHTMKIQAQPSFLLLLLGVFLCVLCAFVVPSAAEPPFYPNKTRLLVYRDANDKEHSITTATDWARRREHILANMQLVMGPLPGDSRKVPLDVQITEEVKTAHFIRKKLTFASEKEDRVPAYLFIPLERAGKLPAVLCLHQTIRIGKDEPAGLGTNENLRY